MFLILIVVLLLNVFVVLVSIWWSFIFYRLNYSFIFENNRIFELDFEFVGCYFVLI